MNNSKIRFGVIGCGYIARKAFLPALIESKNATLVAVSSRSAENAKIYANDFGCESIVGYNNLISSNKIDAVYIATPPASHESIAISAANYGKHILCEKPLAHNIESANNIIRECKKNDVAIFEGFMYQFHSQHKVVNDLIKNGEIGNPILFEAKFGIPPMEENNYRYNNLLGGGALLDVGAYTIHASRKFFGREPKNVYSVIDKKESEVDTHGSILFDYGEGQTALLSFGFNNSYSNQYSIWGSRGHVTVNRAFSIPHDIKPTIILEKNNKNKNINCDPDNHFIKEIDYFCNILKNKKFDKLYEECLAQAEVINKVYILSKN